MINLSILISKREGCDISHLDTRPQKRQKKNELKEFNFDSFLEEWNKLKEHEDANSDRLALSERFYKMKKKIPFNALLKSEEALENMRFLLNMAHPCPMDERSRDYEIRILNRINAILEKGHFKKEGKALQKEIMLDRLPSVIYDYAALNSEQAEKEIDHLYSELEEQGLDIAEKKTKYEQIFSIYHQEIKRFCEVYNAFSGLTNCDGFNLAHLSLGRCYLSLADSYYNAGQEYDKEEFNALSLSKYKKGLEYLNFCQDYFSKFSNAGSDEDRASAAELIAKCKEEIASLHIEIERGAKKNMEKEAVRDFDEYLFDALL
ncbi:MAG: hypothetical protein LW832_08070 [Parachlamydia sp.]|nr:hypothetical protein [Parachlamydia sp.]